LYWLTFCIVDATENSVLVFNALSYILYLLVCYGLLIMLIIYDANIFVNR